MRDYLQSEYNFEWECHRHLCTQKVEGSSTCWLIASRFEQKQSLQNLLAKPSRVLRDNMDFSCDDCEEECTVEIKRFEWTHLPEVFTIFIEDVSYSREKAKWPIITLSTQLNIAGTKYRIYAISVMEFQNNVAVHIWTLLQLENSSWCKVDNATAAITKPTNIKWLSDNLFIPNPGNTVLYYKKA